MKNARAVPCDAILRAPGLPAASPAPTLRPLLMPSSRRTFLTSSMATAAALAAATRPARAAAAAGRE